MATGNKGSCLWRGESPPSVKGRIIPRAPGITSTNKFAVLKCNWWVEKNWMQQRQRSQSFWPSTFFFFKSSGLNSILFYSFHSSPKQTLPEKWSPAPLFGLETPTVFLWALGSRAVSAPRLFPSATEFIQQKRSIYSLLEKNRVNVQPLLAPWSLAVEVSELSWFAALMTGAPLHSAVPSPPQCPSEGRPPRAAKLAVTHLSVINPLSY